MRCVSVHGIRTLTISCAIAQIGVDQCVCVYVHARARVGGCECVCKYVDGGWVSACPPACVSACVLECVRVCPCKQYHNYLPG